MNIQMDLQHSSENVLELLEQLYAKALDLYANGKYDDAIEIFLKLTAVDPENSHYWMGLGAAHQLKNDYQNAIASYVFASTLDVRNPYIPYHIAECFFSLKEIEHGCDALQASRDIINDFSNDDELLERINWLQERWEMRSNERKEMTTWE